MELGGTIYRQSAMRMERNALKVPTKLKVECWTDGACSGNPGPGGWAFLLFFRNCEAEGFGAKEVTTNNEMEFLSAFHAIRAINSLNVPAEVTLFTDSKLLIKGLLSEWDIKAPHLKTILEDIESLIEKGGHELLVRKVKAHSGNKYNEKVDQLAVGAIRR